jgi:hypothetical protein
LRKQHFLVLDEYDPRIHALYFCPQLYRSDGDGTLVALEGEEIGQLLAQSLQDGVVEKRPWYEPSDKLCSPPIAPSNSGVDFDTVVVDGADGKSPARSSLSQTQ